MIKNLIVPLYLLLWFPVYATQVITIKATKKGLDHNINGDHFTQKDISQSMGSTLSSFLEEQYGPITTQNGGSYSLHLRGTRAQDTLLIIDDLPVYDPMGVTGAYNWGHLPLEAFESVDVSFLPQATQYSTSGLGGVIHLKTKQGFQNKQSFSANIQTPSGAHLQSSFTQKMSPKSTFNASFLFDKSEGYNHTKETSTHSPDSDGNETLSFHLGVLKKWKKSIRTGISAHMLSHEQELDSSFGQERDDRNYISTDTEYKLSSFLSFQENRFSYAFHSLKREYFNDMDERQSTQEKQLYSGLAHFFSLQSSPFKLAEFSINYQRESGHFENYSDYTLVSSFKQKRQQNWNLSLHKSLFFNRKKTMIRAGLRQHFYPGQSGFLNAQLDFHQRLPFSLESQLSFGQGSKQASLYQRFDPLFGDAQLKLEKVRFIDLGIKKLMSHQFSFQINFFYQRYDDLIAFSQSIYTNEEKAYNKGLNYSLDVHPWVPLHFHWRQDIVKTYSYTSGKRLLNRPEMTSTFATKYNIAKNHLLSLLLNYKGRRDSTNNEQRPSYVLVHAHWDYPLSRGKTLYLQANNIFDKDYADYSSYHSPPRTLLLGIRMIL